MRTGSAADLSVPNISRAEITEILGGIRPRNMHNYRLALVHRSLGPRIQHHITNKLPLCDYYVEGGKPASNERLEFLGDAILDQIVCEHLFTKFPGRDEGFLTRQKIKVVKGTRCVKFARLIGLERYIQVDNKHALNDNTLEDAFEAFLAAIKLDLGHKFVNEFMIRLIDKHVDFQTLTVDDNFKDILIRYAQAKRIPPPEYLVRHCGAQFTAQVTLRVGSVSMPMGVGSGATRKAAEHEAARKSVSMIEYSDISEIAERDF